MLYPTINDLTKGEFNRYELAIATAKCARLITNEYVRQREKAEKEASGNKDSDRPMTSMIDREFRDEKAVKVAINKIYDGEYRIVRNETEEDDTTKQDDVDFSGVGTLAAPIVIQDDDKTNAEDKKFNFGTTDDGEEDV